MQKGPARCVVAPSATVPCQPALSLWPAAVCCNSRGRTRAGEDPCGGPRARAHIDPPTCRLGVGDDAGPGHAFQDELFRKGQDRSAGVGRGGDANQHTGQHTGQHHQSIMWLLHRSALPLLGLECCGPLLLLTKPADHQTCLSSSLRACLFRSGRRAPPDHRILRRPSAGRAAGGSLSQSSRRRSMLDD